jgi:Uma2 family endonuclease
MSTARRLHHSYEDYLRLLADTDTKLEYCDGEIFAMAGGTPAHAELSAAMIALLRGELADRCKVYSSDLKVRIEPTDLSTFPDASVVCGELRTATIDRNAATNPAIVVEVTSRSTEDYDRGEKLSHYKQLASLQAVLIVSHRRPQITVVRRTDSGFEVREVRSGERLRLDAPALDLALDDVYAGVQLDVE